MNRSFGQRFFRFLWLMIVVIVLGSLAIGALAVIGDGGRGASGAWVQLIVVLVIAALMIRRSIRRQRVAAANAAAWQQQIHQAQMQAAYDAEFARRTGQQYQQPMRM